MQEVLRSGAAQPSRMRQARAPGLHTHIALIACGALAILAAQDAGAQSVSAPQPQPRPRETRQAPPTEPAARAPAIPTPAPSVPLSRQEWRTLQRACAQEWSRRKMAGQTRGLLWVEFSEICHDSR